MCILYIHILKMHIFTSAAAAVSVKCFKALVMTAFLKALVVPTDTNIALHPF